MAKINIKQLSKTRYSAHIKPTPEEKEESDKTAFDSVRSKVKIDGFRKGKVPEHIIKNRYGVDIEEKSLQSLIEMASEQLIKEAEKEIYKIRKVENLEKDKVNFSFDLVYDIMPEVNLGKMKGITLKEFVPEIEPSDIKKEIHEIMKPRAQNKKREGEESAKEGDLLIVSYEQWSDGTPLGDPASGIQIYLGDNQFDEEIEKNIVSKPGKRGDEFKITRDVKQQDGSYKKVDVIVKIDDIYEVIYPELNDQFASEYDEDYKTVKDLESDMKKVLSGRFHVRNMDQEIGSAIDKINEIAEIELPESYMEEKISKYLEENKINLEIFPEKEREEFREIYSREHKKRLVNEHIMKEAMNGLSADDYKNGFIKFVGDNFDKKNAKIFQQLYDAASSKNHNEYTNQLLDKLLRIYHMNLMETFFRNKGLIKKDKKIGFKEFFKEKEA